LRSRPTWESVVAAVEKVKGEKWEQFRDRSGDWGRDMALLVARRQCGLTLRELAAKLEGWAMRRCRWRRVGWRSEWIGRKG